MKSLSFAVLAALGSTFIACAQGESDVKMLESPAAITSTRIIGEVLDGSPTPPPPPKPPFDIASSDVLLCKTHTQGGRTITTRKIQPITLPPPPPPSPPLTPKQEDAYRAQIAEYQDTDPKSGILFLSATVFRFKDAPPRTLVSYWPEGKGETITLWSSADFKYIAGGIHSFVDSSGHTHHLVMGWGSVELDSMQDLNTDAGRAYAAPEIPDLPEGKATCQIVGIQPPADSLTPIQSLHDLYNTEHMRLLNAYHGRERARIAGEEELRLHPPRPKNMVLNFWRKEKTTQAEGDAK